MTNINDFEDIFNNYEQQDQNMRRDLFIITSPDDQQKILSSLTPMNTEVVVVNLNNQKTNKRSSIQLVII
jgi:uncharacterized membrane protein